MSNPDNPRLAAALSYAARGWHVFPCLPRLKVPQGGSNGHTEATRDPERINAWWRVNPNFNVAIACEPSNLFVVDVDMGGMAAWAEIVAADPDLAALVDRCPRVDSPGGGFHLYMSGLGPMTVGRPNTERKIATGIDTRSVGSYVIAPPSYVDDGKSKGIYKGNPEAGDPPPVYTPLLARIGERRTVDAPRVPETERQWDVPETITRAEAWLSGLALAGDVAVEGEGGDAYTFEVCCKILEMAIKPDTAFDLLADLWNPYCSPPWSPDELRAKITNAWTYGQETKGGKAERPIAETFAHFVAPEKTPDIVQAEADLKARYKVKSYGEAMTNRKPLEWLVEGFLPRKGIGMVYGKSETLKTFLMIDLALSIATGHGPNWWEGRRKPRHVLFLAGESPDAMLTKRIPAWLAMHLDPSFYALVEANFFVVEGVPPLEMHTTYEDILEDVREHRADPVLVVIDTASRAMAGKDENSSKDVGWATMKMESLSRSLNAFVMCIHHSGKDLERGARGSYVWHCNMDMMLEAVRPDEKELKIEVNLKKLKEGGKTDLPLAFNGTLYNGTPALTRDWNPPEPTEIPARVVAQRDSEEWFSEKAICDELAKGPMQQDHLALSLSRRYGVKEGTIRRKLKSDGPNRHPTLVKGDIWTLPASHPDKPIIAEEIF